MLPSLPLLEKIQQKIQNLPNKQGEYKRQIHYGCYLLCEKAGLRVSEAVNFDLSSKTCRGLYRLNKPKGQKERFVYIPKEVISKLKKHDWKPNHTNRFNFYHFLKKIKRELGISQNIELTPHTLRRAFTTYQAENGLPLPLLAKMLGHASVRTTALYWMNIYNDDGSDTDDILTAKIWPKKPPWKPKLESAAPVNLNLDQLPELLAPNSLASEPPPNYLSKINHLEQQLNQIQVENNYLKEQNTDLQKDLAESNEQSTNLRQNLAEKDQIIKQLEQKLADKQEKCLTAENNLAREKRSSHNLRQQLRSEREINASLIQKLHAYEQNHTNLINAYQNAITAKQNAEKQLNQLTKEIKNAVYLLSQWQKLHYYQQLGEQNKFQAQIIQTPPWRNK